MPITERDELDPEGNEHGRHCRSPIVVVVIVCSTSREIRSWRPMRWPKGSPHVELSDDKLKRIVTRITDIRIDARHSDDS